MSIINASAFDVLISERTLLSTGTYYPGSPIRLRAGKRWPLFFEPISCALLIWATPDQTTQSMDSETGSLIYPMATGPYRHNAYLGPGPHGSDLNHIQLPLTPSESPAASTNALDSLYQQEDQRFSHLEGK
jgi:hypothetical protein